MSERPESGEQHEQSRSESRNPIGVDRDDDRRHPGSGSTALFGCHRLDVLADDGQSALVCQVMMVGGLAQYTAAVLDHEQALVVVETDIAAPGAGWELRASGLWAEQVCETALEHWSYGLEAFGLVVEDAAELLGRGYGDRRPVGWELEFERVGPPTWDDDGCVGYHQDGIVHGLLLDEAGERTFSGVGRRSHWWAGIGPTVIEVQRVDIESLRIESLAAPTFPDLLSRVWIPDGLTPWLTTLSVGGVRSERRSAPKENANG